MFVLIVILNIMTLYETQVTHKNRHSGSLLAGIFKNIAAFKDSG